MSISIVSIESQTLKRRSYKAEVALVSSLYTIDTSIISINVLCNRKVIICILTCLSEVAAEIFVRSPLYIHILDVLIEETQTHQTYTLEIMIG